MSAETNEIGNPSTAKSAVACCYECKLDFIQGPIVSEYAAGKLGGLTINSTRRDTHYRSHFNETEHTPIIFWLTKRLENPLNPTEIISLFELTKQPNNS